MAGQIAAHVTLVYPAELRRTDSLPRIAERVAARTPPFTAELGPAYFVGSPADGVFFRVRDVDGGIGGYRAAAIQPDRMVDFPPHVTIVHPRTSDRGAAAWNELADLRLTLRFVVSEVVVTAPDGDRWRTRAVLPLTRPSRSMTAARAATTCAGTAANGRS